MIQMKALLLAEFGKKLEGFVGQRVFNSQRLAGFDHQADQPLAARHAHPPYAAGRQALGRGQGQVAEAVGCSLVAVAGSRPPTCSRAS